MEYPKKFKYIDGCFIVEFVSEGAGTCVEVFNSQGGAPNLGYFSNGWISCTDTSHWVPIDITRHKKLELLNSIKDFV